MWGRALMVARVLFPVLTCEGMRAHPRHRATIKALPTLKRSRRKKLYCEERRCCTHNQAKPASVIRPNTTAKT